MRTSKILFILSLTLVLGWSCDKKPTGESGEPAKAAAQSKASAGASAGDVARGKELFAEKTCSACHKMEGKVVGPPLRGVVAKRGEDWVFKMIQSPDEMVKTDPVAKKLFEEYNRTPMPNLNLSDDETRAIVAYLESEG